LPQFALSDVKSRQARLHAVSPAPHAVVQLPALQTSVPLQAVAHTPQLTGSDEVSTHVPEQSFMP